jgi:amidohydrolase
MDNAELLADARRIGPTLTKIRRYLHQNPELGWEEYRTAELAAKELEKLGLQVHTGVAKTGVVGLLRGKPGGPTLAIRAEMDALPLQEKGRTPYTSRNKGVMHACGHDAHTAASIGAAMLLAERMSNVKGCIKFLFQPSEENPPSGARGMIEAGVLSRPAVDAVLALHVDATLSAGQVGTRSGPVMSPVHIFRITIKGRSGHAAFPQHSVDAIAVAAQAIQALQHLVSRETDPRDSLAISIGKIHGGSNYNVVAEQVEMEGTVRLLNPELGDRLPERIERLLKNVTRGLGARCTLDYQIANPMVINDPRTTLCVTEAARELLGPENVADHPPSLGGEDFAFYLERVPGCMFRLGAGDEKRGIVHSWHHPRFDIDESCLPIGASLLAGAAVRFLEENA